MLTKEIGMNHKIEIRICMLRNCSLKTAKKPLYLIIVKTCIKSVF